MCSLISSHTQILNSDRHIKALNEATAKHANNIHIIVYVMLLKHFTQQMRHLDKLSSLYLPVLAWGVWWCDLCVFSGVFVCCHLSQISSWAPFLIFASSLDLPSVQPEQLADWLCLLQWELWLVTKAVNQRNEGGLFATFWLWTFFNQSTTVIFVYVFSVEK